MLNYELIILNWKMRKPIGPGVSLNIKHSTLIIAVHGGYGSMKAMLNYELIILNLKTQRPVLPDAGNHGPGSSFSILHSPFSIAVHGGCS
jgi:hypothetical protein